jgi:basic membrane protein A
MTIDIEPVRVAVIMPSSTTDLAWSQSMFSSLERVQAAAGGSDVFEIAFSEGMFNVTDAAAAIRDYAADSYDIVIVHGTQYGTSLAEIAPDFPDTTFATGIATDPTLGVGLENVFAYDAHSVEGGYVNGVLAGSLTQSGVIGFVGPVEAGDVTGYIAGFQAGVAEANPDAVVNISYTGSFGDTALAAEAANVHIDAGADVLSGSAQQVVGAIGVAKEKGVLWIGTQSDQSSLDPATAIAAQVYDWDSVLIDIITKHQAGQLGGDAYLLTLENGGLSMTFSDSLPAEAVAAAQAAVDAIKAGDVPVAAQ